MGENPWKGQIHVEVCPSTQWRDATFIEKPLTFEDFDISSDDFDVGAYIQRIIKNNAITCGFLAASLFTLLLFLLWRFVRSCCVMCCCTDTCDKRRRRHSDILWTRKSALLKVFLILASVTAASLAGYSSSNLDVTLSNDAWNTIYEVKDKIDDVLSIGDNLTGNLNNTVGLLQNVSDIFDTEINVASLRQNVQCIHDFLRDIPEPGSLTTAISSLNTLLTTTLYDGLELFSTRLSALETESLSSIRDPVQTTQESKKWFLQFSTELTDLQSAIDDLETTYANPSAAEASATQLRNVRQAVRDVTVLESDLNDLIAALNSLSGSNVVSQMTDVESSIHSVETTIITSKTDLESTETALQALQSTYAVSAPCMTTFLTRFDIIGADVIELPSNVSDSYGLLRPVAESFNQLLAADAPTGEVLDSLFDIGEQIELPDPANLENEITSVKTDFASITTQASTFISDVNSLISTLPAFNTLMSTLQTKLDTYLDSSTTEANYNDMRDYSKDVVRPSVSALAGDVSGILTSFDTVFTSAENMHGIDSSLVANLNSQTADIQATIALIDNIPDLTTMETMLDDISLAYDNLGAHPESILADVETMFSQIDTLVSDTLQSVHNDVQSVTNEADKALKKARADSIEEINDFESEKRNLTLSHFFSKPEDIGFALLADDVNDKLYLVTLCFYCAAIVLSIGLVISVMMNCQFGIGATLFLFLLLVFLYYLIALVSSTILIIENDVCANLEEIARAENSDAELDQLLRYYFTDYGNVRSVLLEAFDLDFVDIEEQAVVASERAESIITDWETKGQVNLTLGAIDASVQQLLEFVWDLEDSLEYKQIHPLYQKIKSFFCCDIAAFLFTIWKDLMLTGAMSLFVIILGCYALHQIDKMPRVDCCGCTRRRRYFDDILAEHSESKMSSMIEKASSSIGSRKGSRIGTDFV